jgi:hypothetical protein
MTMSITHAPDLRNSFPFAARRWHFAYISKGDLK